MNRIIDFIKDVIRNLTKKPFHVVFYTLDERLGTPIKTVERHRSLDKAFDRADYWNDAHQSFFPQSLVRYGVIVGEHSSSGSSGCSGFSDKSKEAQHA